MPHYFKSAPITDDGNEREDDVRRLELISISMHSISCLQHINFREKQNIRHFVKDRLLNSLTR
ncbi:hypothetical protein BDF20DRAFT_879559 [Mycotypha africana]|uniref:uncharacterized protein n=1 Tax=Mycotypha africana TaxID=64632 RepID=UPI002301C6F6|nr:uncharacterized protein BDF20DRAFT_879559 [Mycotypha africana]KAI8975598.1 hypothetical protein BDF20DRAFT_879559 [Mycotypha africana]